jgi:aspartyl-tRNA(Asn)/glutamyl-tRNA(Gln) amidotransferase subunit C
MITLKELEHLSVLARIKLTDEDKRSLIKEFDSILGYIDQIKSVALPSLAEAETGDADDVLREDLAKPVSDEDRERLLREAPHRVGDYIAVKKIIAGD